MRIKILSSVMNGLFPHLLLDCWVIRKLLMLVYFCSVFQCGLLFLSFSMNAFGYSVHIILPECSLHSSSIVMQLTFSKIQLKYYSKLTNKTVLKA